MAISLRVGTSGYAYREWKGSFYPENLPAADMLGFYAEHFGTVEINNTFYRMPTAAALQKQRSAVPEPFVFVLKAPQEITHRARLKDVQQPLSHFFEVATALGPGRGPTLFQLPPYLKKDVPRLRAFLQAVPKSERVALEFRHASWHDDAVYAALRERNAALCLADTDDGVTPREVTANWGYLRLRRKAYPADALRLWHAWIGAQSWGDVYVFFKHEAAGSGPAFAQQLLGIAARG